MTNFWSQFWPKVEVWPILTKILTKNCQFDENLAICGPESGWNIKFWLFLGQNVAKISSFEKSIWRKKLLTDLFIAEINFMEKCKTTQTTSRPLQRLEPLQAIIYGFGLEVQNQYHAQDMKLSLIIVEWQTSNFRQEIRQSHYRNDPAKYGLAELRSTPLTDWIQHNKGFDVVLIFYFKYIKKV